MGAYEHAPVLLDEALASLAVRPDGIYVDATFGRGGHSRAILDRLGPRGRLIAIDRDPEAVKAATGLFGDDRRFTVHRGTFSMLEQIVTAAGCADGVQGVLLDLGVSSPQLDDPARGFSFQQAGPLDMRMDPEYGESVAEWLQRAAEREIADVIFQYGEERFGRRIARAIVQARAEGPITDTAQLAAIVAAAVPTRERNKHPATRTFQALRIHINRELDELDACLEQSVRVLAAGGRLAVISFHSLEDRRVKRFMRDAARPRPPADMPPGMPVALPEPTLKLIGKPIFAAEEEVSANPRARSAVLRTAERL